VDGEPCLFDIYDTPGQDDYSRLREQVIRSGEGFLIVYSVSSRESFNKVQDLYSVICKVKLEQLQSVEQQADDQRQGNSGPVPDRSFFELGQDPPVLIVGNKNDLSVFEREVSYNEGVACAASLNVGFIETSATAGHNVNNAFCVLARDMDWKRELVMEAIDQDQGDPRCWA
jgi:GTPase KRas protein